MAIVLFGATGYTGDLTARSLVRRGRRPVLAARSAEKVSALAGELGGLEHRVADVADPASVRALVQRGDVLVSTVGPFARWGRAAVESAIAGGAHYIDSTGETPFIRSVFEQWGPRAQSAEVVLLTAMGYDWVPGNLAGALALREAGERATRVEIGYFATGSLVMSGGTRASAAGVMLEPSFAFRDGRLQTERGAKRARSFAVRPGKERTAVTVGSSEHFGLPPLHPSLRDVDVYLGWFGSASGSVQAVSAAAAAITKVPGVRAGLRALTGKAVKGSTGGPDAEARAGGGSVVLAEAKDASGAVLAGVRLEGPDGYTFTADMLAEAAIAAEAGDLHGSGALGPVQAFGLDELEAAAARTGLERAAIP